MVMPEPAAADAEAAVKSAIKAFRVTLGGIGIFKPAPDISKTPAPKTPAPIEDEGRAQTMAIPENGVPNFDDIAQTMAIPENGSPNFDEKLPTFHTMAVGENGSPNFDEGNDFAQTMAIPENGSPNFDEKPTFHTMAVGENGSPNFDEGNDFAQTMAIPENRTPNFDVKVGIDPRPSWLPDDAEQPVKVGIDPKPTWLNRGTRDDSRTDEPKRTDDDSIIKRLLKKPKFKVGIDPAPEKQDERVRLPVIKRGKLTE